MTHMKSNDAVALRVEPPVKESGAGFESLPASSTPVIAWISEVAAEIQHEDLQEAWDRWLMIHSLSNDHMAKLCAVFMSDHGLTLEQFFSLKRTPRFKRHTFAVPSRFMAAYVPGMWEQLLNNAPHDVIIDYLKRHQPDTFILPADRRKSQAESKERYKTRVADARNKLETIGWFDFWDKARDRNWKTVKAVRSK